MTRDKFYLIATNNIMHVYAWCSHSIGV